MSFLCDPSQASETSTPHDFDSEAWLLVGMTRSLAGWLALRDGHLAFADDDGDVHFCASLDDIDRVWSPWYYFGGGIKIRIAGNTFRMSFTLPNDQPGGNRQPLRHGPELVRGASAVGFASQKLSDVAQGRALTRQWLKVLGLVRAN